MTLNANATTAKYTMAAGPVSIHDRVRQAYARQLLYHYDPAFHALFDDTTQKLQQVFQTTGDVAIMQGEAVLDLCYEEDSMAEADFNVVMTSEGQYVEVQGTAEGSPFGRAQIGELLDLADKGIEELLALQRRALK